MDLKNLLLELCIWILLNIFIFEYARIGNKIKTGNFLGFSRTSLLRILQGSFYKGILKEYFIKEILRTFLLRNFQGLIYQGLSKERFYKGSFKKGF